MCTCVCTHAVWPGCAERVYRAQEQADSCAAGHGEPIVGGAGPEVLCCWNRPLIKATVSLRSMHVHPSVVARCVARCTNPISIS